MKKTNKQNLYKKGKCGQGYEDDKCINCKWCGGLDLGFIACMKGLKKKGIIWLGKK